MRRFLLLFQEVIEASSLAVQKSQANRNELWVLPLADASLAVQKSQANRNGPSNGRGVPGSLAVQKSQANRMLMAGCHSRQGGGVQKTG